MSFIPLSKAAISALLPQQLKIDVFQIIDSTNDFLKSREHSLLTQLCCAEQQTKGRGRFSRSWDSPFGKNIYLSLRLTLPLAVAQLSGLGLAVCLSIIKTLGREDLQVKWPNDIVFNDKKCCGILIEIVRTMKNQTDLIIGIGLNVNEEDDVKTPWIALSQITGQLYDRNVLIARIVLSLLLKLEKFCHAGLAPFMEDFNKYDYLLDKEISLTQAERSITGICRGINLSGLLCFEDLAGQLHYVSSGNTTLSKGFVPS